MGRPQSTEPAWNAGSQQAFSTQFKNNVPLAWNRKWKFRCTRAGFTNYVAEPIISIVDGTLADYHFRVSVRNCGGQSYLNAVQNYLVLHKTDNDEYDNINPPSLLNPMSVLGMSRGGVVETERTKVANLLAPVQQITLARTGFGWVVDPGSRPGLATFARELMRVGSLAPKFPLTIHASSGADGKADAIVVAVMDYLRQSGLDTNRYPIGTDSQTTRAKFKLPFSGHKGTAVASITLSDDRMGVGINWRYRYKVANHEFGHCLGLPDEYQDQYPGPIGTNIHNQWRALCAQAGVNPNAAPSFNQSIMSCGWTTSACHFVTIWDALGRLTNVPPYNVQRTDWVVERGSQPDVL